MSNFPNIRIAMLCLFMAATAPAAWGDSEEELQALRGEVESLRQSLDETRTLLEEVRQSLERFQGETLDPAAGKLLEEWKQERTSLELERKRVAVQQKRLEEARQAMARMVRIKSQEAEAALDERQAQAPNQERRAVAHARSQIATPYALADGFVFGRPHTYVTHSPYVTYPWYGYPNYISPGARAYYSNYYNYNYGPWRSGVRIQYSTTFDDMRLEGVYDTRTEGIHDTR